MSSAVAEAKSQVPSTNARPKAGQGNQSSSGDAFSGMVDDNLAATDTGEMSSTERSQRSARAEGTDQPPRTGVRRNENQTNSARQASTEQAPHDTRSADASTNEETSATPAPQAVVSAGIVTPTIASEQVETASDAESDDASAPAGAPVTVTTSVVAAAVTVQIELASETPASVIDSGDALTISNPPATIAAAPAETAANALARVALDTGEAQASAVAESDAQVQTAADVAASAAATETPSTATTAANATDVAADADAAVTTAVQIETTAADAQLEAKAAVELSAAAKTVDPSKPVEEPKPDQIIASTDAKPGQVRTDARVAAEPLSAPKPDTQDDRRVEADTRSEAPSSKPAETEARSAQRPAHEPALAASAHAQTSASEQPQPTGFGASQTGQLHMSNVAIAQLTAVPAANVAVPINGLAVEIAANLQIGRSRFEIRLDPPELGRIDVRLDVDRQGQVTSHLIVEKPATLDLLRRDAQQLERALQDAGLKTSDNGLQFSLRDQQQQSGRNDDNGSGRNAQRLIVADEETIAAETTARSYGRMIGQRGGIDIRV